MGEVIMFRPRPGGNSTGAPATTGAQIMFFTGVRYERMAEPVATLQGGGEPSPTERLGKSGRGRKRRRG